jgi:hypothetical protein
MKVVIMGSVPPLIDTPHCQTLMSDMTTTLRKFQRELALMRRAAVEGAEVLVRDREGNTFLFKRIDAPVPTMMQVVGHLAGSGSTGKKVKSLAGYGRR